MRMTANTGATDEHCALNYLAMQNEDSYRLMIALVKDEVFQGRLIRM